MFSLARNSVVFRNTSTLHLARRRLCTTSVNTRTRTTSTNTAVRRASRPSVHTTRPFPAITNTVRLWSRNTKRPIFPPAFSYSTIMPATTPPPAATLAHVSRMDWTLAPEDIQSTVKEIIAESNVILDRIASIPSGEHTFENTVKVIGDMDGLFEGRRASCDFPMHVVECKATRDSSTEASEALEKFDIECWMREDVFRSVQAVAESDAAKALEGEDARLLDRVMRAFKRNGLALDSARRDQLKALKVKTQSLCTKFQKALNEVDIKHEFTKEELEGLPQDYLDRLNKSEDGLKFVVTIKYPDLFPILRHAKVEETRQIMEKLQGTQCMEHNAPILEEIVSLRHEMAQLLDFETWSDYVLDVRMAKTRTAVSSFMDELKEKLTPLASSELAELLVLKEAEKKERNEPFDGKINGWDFRYYVERYKEKNYELREEEVTPYFPMEKVIQGSLDIYQTIFGLTFERVPADIAPVWHKDVDMYRVHDTATNAFMGHFFLDLHPRQGKYGHAAVFPLQHGLVLEDGNKQYPAAAMVCNFTKPSPTAPSLLKHDEVVTFLHEFGHAVHGVCGHTKYGMFAGTSTERDFVEAPSQLLENWGWEKEILTRLSSHYKDGTPLPETTIDKMLSAKRAMAGLLYRRQLFFAAFDQSCHTSAKVNTQELWTTLRKEITLIPNTEGTNGAAAFAHITGGYDSSYYGYLWSEVYSADLFTRFKEEGILSTKLGKLYRDEVIGKGGSVDGMDMVRAFLGREPNQDAFLKSIGL